MQRLKDPTLKNIFQDPRTGIYYGRKYVNGREIERSLKTTNRHLAVQRWNKLLADWPKDKQKSVTFEDYASGIIDNVYAYKAKKTWQDMKGSCDLHLIPYLGPFALTEIGAQWPLYKAHQRRITPNRKLWHDRKALLTLLRMASREGLIERVPELPLDLSDKVVKRGREIRNDEIRKIIAEAPPKWKLKIELQLKTGMRSNERRHLKWENVDLANGHISLPASQTKTRTARSFYLDKSLKSALMRLKSAAKSPYVFPNRRDPMRPEAEGQKTFQRIKKTLKTDVKLHWLRHTAATRAKRAGASDQTIKEAYGMSNRILDAVYHHINDDDRKKLARDVSKSTEGLWE